MIFISTTRDYVVHCNCVDLIEKPLRNQILMHNLREVDMIVYSNKVVIWMSWINWDCMQSYLSLGWSCWMGRFDWVSSGRELGAPVHVIAPVTNEREKSTDWSTRQHMFSERMVGLFCLCVLRCDLSESTEQEKISSFYSLHWSMVYTLLDPPFVIGWLDLRLDDLFVLFCHTRGENTFTPCHISTLLIKGWS